MQSLDLSPAMLAILCVAFFVVALLYGSVGHGGASGYLAVWSFLTLEPNVMASSALCLNLLVAGTAWCTFAHAGHLSRRLTWPFIITSIPAALFGGQLAVAPLLYGWLLAGTLLVAAVRLALPTTDGADTGIRPPPLAVALPTGAGIGVLSGIVGVGGGIFLSPLMLLMQWATPKYVAATAACFIVVNSAAALLGRMVGDQLVLNGSWLLIGFAFAGGLIGSRLGARHFSGGTLRRVLAVVLIIAAGKIAWRVLT